MWSKATLILLLVLVISAWGQSDPGAQVDTLTAQGDYASAIELATEILTAQQKHLGPRDPQVAESEVRLGALYLETSAYDRARPLFEAALALRQQDADADGVTEARNYLAAADVALHQYQPAASLLEAALASARQRQSGVAEALDNLASVYQQAGRLQDASRLLREEVSMSRATPALQVPALRTLALVDRELGHYVEAESTYRQALDVATHTWPAADAQVVSARTDLAFLCMDEGRFADADHLLAEALGAVETAHGPDAPETAEARNNVAILATDMGDYARANRLLVDVLHAEQQIFAGDPQQMVRTLDSLADVELEAAQYDQAEAHYQAALRLAPGDPYLEERLANVYVASHDYAKAQGILTDLYNVTARQLGGQHPETAHSAMSLADVYVDQHQYQQAVPLYQQAAGIYATTAGVSHPSTLAARIKQAMALVCSGQVDAAKPVVAQISADMRGAPADVDTLQNLKMLACLQSDLGAPHQALQAALQAQTLDDRILRDISSFTTQRERLAYRATMDPSSTLASLGAVPELAQSMLRHKGVVLDSILEDIRASREATGEARNQLMALQDARHQMAQPHPDQAALKLRIETLQAALAQHGIHLDNTARALSTTVAQVQAALPADAVLVDYLQYNRYDGRDHWTPAYGAMLIPHAEVPHWVPLGDAATLDRLAGYYRATLHGHGDTVALERLLPELYQKAWAPLVPALPPGTRQVVVSPDGSLNSISMATLLAPDNRFVGDSLDVAYVASGRDLLLHPEVSHDNSMVIIADPDFTATLPDDSEESYLQANQLAGLNFPRLEGTAREGRRLAHEAEQLHWTPHLLTGAQATTAALDDLHAPYILHLATHGFFVPDPDRSALSTDNPMARSGLALTGAETTLEALKAGRRSSGG
ncbi:MAG: CHAT domain-containing protein, partial [Candidatus Xenobia bacterium]